MQVGGGTKGYPTADVTNIVGVPQGGLKTLLKWTDPEDTVMDNAVLAEWKSTLIIRKAGSIPESIKDGALIFENEIRNQYKDTWYEDTDSLIDGVTYYYRFFTKSSTGVIGDGSPTVRITVANYDPILANNSWEIISEVAESGAASEIWNIGDEITISFSSPYFSEATFQIADFNHFDKTDGTGKAGIVFVSKELLYADYSGAVSEYGFRFNASGSEIGYPSSDAKKIVEGIFNLMDANARKFCKNIVLPCDTGLSDPQKTSINALTFIPSAKEVGKSVGNDDSTPFQIFTDNTSRIKISKTNSKKSIWWTRTGVKTINGNKYAVKENGGVTEYGASNGAFACLCFCV